MASITSPPIRTTEMTTTYLATAPLSPSPSSTPIPSSGGSHSSVLPVPATRPRPTTRPRSQSRIRSRAVAAAAAIATSSVGGRSTRSDDNKVVSVSDDVGSSSTRTLCNNSNIRAISEGCNSTNNVDNHCYHHSHYPPLSLYDKALVCGSSLVVFTSVAWVPLMCYKLYQYWKHLPIDTLANRRRKKRIGWALVLASLIVVKGPHRSVQFGERVLKIRQWRLWKAWIKYVAFQVIVDDSDSTGSDNDGLVDNNNTNNNTNTSHSPSLSSFDVKTDQAILAVIPHGLFPLPLALAALPEQASAIFGTFRPVVATATALFPFVRSFLGHLNAVDATRSSVNQALENGDRIGVSPGGIAEMFVPLDNPNEEYVLLKHRKGLVRMSVKHQIPIVPIYVFGGSRTFNRLSLPHIFEYLSKLWRISICIFYGKWGLPIPLRSKLLYVMGKPLFPPLLLSASHNTNGGVPDNELVDAMHEQFCARIVSLFDRHKKAYGWANKQLKII